MKPLTLILSPCLRREAVETRLEACAQSVPLVRATVDTSRDLTCRFEVEDFAKHMPTTTDHLSVRWVRTQSTHRSGAFRSCRQNRAVRRGNARLLKRGGQGSRSAQLV